MIYSKSMVFILSLIRHALTFVGGYLVAKGMIDEATSQQLIGVLIAVIGQVASFLEKQSRDDP